MPSSAPSPKTLGRYEILTRLASGGMAEIFLARERGLRGLERLVVIKRILPYLKAQESFVEMFVREARIIARLSHPNVVQIYELAEEEEEFYIVMEYIVGGTLRELGDAVAEAGRRIPVEACVSVVAQAARGAHAAHELVDTDGKPLEIVHRDISPHNVMVTREGGVKLLDFGIAKAQEGADQTETGTIKGKYSYMSPEQCKHEVLDRRSDIFSLGIVLWELLAGERLFRRESELATMQAIVDDDARGIEDARPEVPLPIRIVMRKALARDKAARYQTADEFRRALLEAATSSNLNPTEDAVARVVLDVLGERHDSRQRELEAAVQATRTGSSGSARSDHSHKSYKSHKSHSSNRSHDEPRSGRLPPVVMATDPDVNPPAALARPKEAQTLVERPATGSVRAPSSARLSAPPPRGPELTSSLSRRATATEAFGGRKVAVTVGVLAALLGAVLASTLLAWLIPVNADPPAPLVGAPLRLIMAPVMDPKVISDESEPLRGYLEAQFHRPVHILVAPSYEDTSRALLAGDVQLASMPPYLYVVTRQKDPRVEVLVFKAFDGALGTDGVLLVHEQSGVNTVQDMVGKRFCYTDRESTTGWLLPRAFLKSVGLDPDLSFGSVRLTGDHLTLLRDLNAGLCDVGATYSGAYVSADRAGISVGRMRVLAVTGRCPQDAIIAGPGATPEERQMVRAALLQFDPRRDLRVPYVGNVQRLTGFVAAEDAAYDPMRVAIRASLPAAAPDGSVAGVDGGDTTGSSPDPVSSSGEGASSSSSSSSLSASSSGVDSSSGSSSGKKRRGKGKKKDP
jgi:serine/threonine-protein kinase